MEGKVCSKCGVWKPLEGYNKNKNYKDGKQPKCRECQKEYTKQYRESSKELEKERKKRYYQNNKENIKERNKQYYQNNKENIKEQRRQYRKNNKEYIKGYNKQWKEDNKQNNLQYIFSMVEQINPVFKQLNLPVYGYVYMFENVKTGHKYIGQSVLPITRRYTGGIVQGWIKERLNKHNQKFKNELLEEDIEVTEVLDVAFCQYHLDKLEAYYIDRYDSFLNGYNNNAGHHDTDDYIEEFNRILLENNLEFIDGKLVKIA